MSTEALELARMVRDYFDAIDTGKPYLRSALEMKAAQILLPPLSLSADSICGMLMTLNAEAAERYKVEP